MFSVRRVFYRLSIGLSVFVLATVARAVPMVDGFTGVSLDSLSVAISDDTNASFSWDRNAGYGDAFIDLDPSEFSADVTPVHIYEPGSVSYRSSSQPTLDGGFFYGQNSLGTDLHLSQLSQGVGAYIHQGWDLTVNGKGLITVSIDYELGMDIVNDTDGVYAEGFSDIRLGISNRDYFRSEPLITGAHMGNYSFLGSVERSDSAATGTLMLDWMFDTCTVEVIGYDPADYSEITSESCIDKDLYFSINLANTARISEKTDFLAEPVVSVPAPATIFLFGVGLTIFSFRRFRQL
ncbi:MAG: PEP-CTERM sorting domain-containing protein [Gammaproteobacteria bacterium]|nr:PEP-CTERM sorting domain-containing protein [Gammaproteobacteria bacterium]